VDFDESSSDARFRADARGWLEAAAITEAGRGVLTSAHRGGAAWVARARRWQAHLADHGWAGIAWPVDSGGRGGTPSEAAIFQEESARVGLLVNTFAVGIAMAGPTIIAHGNDAQRRRFLPPLLRGDEVWCQLFSEPGAGSDLAGLSTRAVRDGDEWVVNGQ
jgi:acyl-CoA dehydrogenase